MPNIDLSILNQRQTPAFYADTLANRPSAGFVGRIFVSTNTFAFYRDNGTGWDLIGGPGTGTITGSGATGQIALWDGASTITGDSGLTYNGTDNSLTASKFIVTGGTSSQFLKADGSVDSNSYVPYTGATASLDMGLNNILGQNYFIRGDNTTSGGYLGFRQFNGSSSGTSGYTSISALAQNSLYLQFSQLDTTNKTIVLNSGLLGTTPRQYQFPDADGTLALTSNILNIYNSNGTLSGERTVSLNGNNLIFDGGASIARVRLDADTNVARIFSFATNSIPRFAIRVDGTESGGNTGSDYAIRRYDDAGTFVDAPLTITRSTGQSTFAKKVVIENNAGDQQLQIVSTTAPSLRLDNAQTGATKRAGLGISTAVNNFIQGSADQDYCIFNSSTTASPILFGIYDAGLTNTQEAARISAARNFLIGTTVDNGYKLRVNGSMQILATSEIADMLTINYSDISTGENKGLQLSNVGGGGKVYNITAGQTGQNNADFVIRNSTNNVNNLVFDGTSGAATFSGSVTTNSSFRTDGGVLQLFRASVFRGGLYTYDAAIGSGTDYSTTITSETNTYFLAGGSITRAMSLIGSTGNLLIGATTDVGQRLYVSGNIYNEGKTITSYQTNASIQDQYGNDNAQGTAQKFVVLRQYSVVSLGTKLIIPIKSQTSQNNTTLCRVWGHSARYNSRAALGFEINFSVGSLNLLSDLTSWGGSGNFSGVSIAGMNIEIDFTTAYTSGTANGIFVTIEYMTANNSGSVDVANITMN
jgi:hypothetical protein